MKKKDKYGNTDYNDLIRYVQGDMSDEERHALEKELQKDLFASEALEGLSSQRIEEVREDLDRLERNLNARTRSRRSVGWIRIAASLAVIITIGTLYFTVFTDMINRTDRMAVETESQEETRDKTALELPEVPSKSETSEKRSPSAEPIMGDEGKGGEIQEEIQESAQQKTRQLDMEKSAEKEAASEEHRMSESMVRNEELLSDVVSGDQDTVFEIDAEILENQNELLVVEDETQQILADEFAFETKPAPSRAISADITLPTAMAESPEGEVPGVKESGMAAKKAAAPPVEPGIPVVVIISDSTRSNPVGGMSSFRRFFTDNLAYPLGEPGDTGAKVILNFNVDSSGRPGNISVVESSGQAFSREAVRVLEEGPDWVTDQDRIQLLINFIAE